MEKRRGNDKRQRSAHGQARTNIRGRGRERERRRDSMEQSPPPILRERPLNTPPPRMSTWKRNYPMLPEDEYDISPPYPMARAMPGQMMAPMYPGMLPMNAPMAPPMAYAPGYQCEEQPVPHASSEAQTEEATEASPASTPTPEPSPRRREPRICNMIEIVDELPPMCREALSQSSATSPPSDDDSDIQQIPRKHLPEAVPKVAAAGPAFPQVFQYQPWQMAPMLPPIAPMPARGFGNRYAPYLRGGQPQMMSKYVGADRGRLAPSNAPP